MFARMSNHYHLLVTDIDGCLPDFVQELNSLLSRQLNAILRFSGSNIEKQYNLVEIAGEVRLTEHAVYRLLNPVRAGLVAKARHWKGSSSVRMEYGAPVELTRPRSGMWNGAKAHANKKKSMRSGRAAFAGRWTTPESASLIIDRPQVLMHLSDAEYRAYVRALVESKEQIYEKARNKRGRQVLGWRQVIEQSYLAVPISHGSHGAGLQSRV